MTVIRYPIIIYCWSNSEPLIGSEAHPLEGCTTAGAGMAVPYHGVGSGGKGNFAFLLCWISCLGSLSWLTSLFGEHILAVWKYHSSTISFDRQYDWALDSRLKIIFVPALEGIVLLVCSTTARNDIILTSDSHSVFLSVLGSSFLSPSLSGPESLAVVLVFSSHWVRGESFH